jgi:hypothetical protein
MGKNPFSCRRCGFSTRIHFPDGWMMADETTGLCPACVADDAATSKQPERLLSNCQLDGEADARKRVNARVISDLTLQTDHPVCVRKPRCFSGFEPDVSQSYHDVRLHLALDRRLRWGGGTVRICRTRRE